MSIPENDIRRLTEYSITDYCENIYGTEFTRSGKYCIANCIFDDHHEKTPSFTVDLTNNTFKCYGKCGRNGDLINLVKYKENMNFFDACVTISKNIGYKLNLQPPNPEHEAYKNSMTAYKERYFYNLWETHTEEIEKVLDYLHSRGFTNETLIEFGIGFTPQDEYKNRKDISNIGGRISIPIFENVSFESKVIAHSFRTMKDVLDPFHYDKKKEVKYKNDCTTKGELEGIWTKGNTFYNYQKALPHIRNCKCAIIVEGYFDVIALWQSKIANVLGNMTSNLNDSLADKLSTITKDVIIFLDADDTGSENSKLAVSRLLARGVNVKVVLPINGKDPADYCLSKKFNGDEIGRQIYTKGIDGWKFIVDKETDTFESEMMAKKLAILKRFLPMVNNFPEAEKIVYMDYLYKKIGIKG